MIRHLPSLVLAGVLAFSQTAAAQVKPEDALATFTVADGLELSLFAAEPQFCNPTCIDIDHKGRVWVCEAVNYRRKLRNQQPLRKEGDRILILEDNDGDGKADKVHTFYQAPEVTSPLGIAVAPYPDGKGQKVYVCQSPNIWVFEDRDGDLKADGPPTVMLKGFQGIDHDHGVHSVLLGPDGKLYFTVGDQGVRDLQSSDGQGKKWSSNSTDCRAGTVWRCDLDGKNLELIAHNFRNNYECCVDSFGTIFLSDNDDDGNRQTRICHVMPGGNYGYHPRGSGQSHWHEEQPGIVHKVLRTGFGSPTGICFYEGTLLPKKYHGQLIHADAGPREIRCFHLKVKGAGYEAEQENLVTSKDTWFRPSDVCVAPDGSLFIADWYDPGVGGHGMGDTTRGRIYRLTPKGHKGYKVPEVDVKTPKGFLEALASPALSVRSIALGFLFQNPPPKEDGDIAPELSFATVGEKQDKERPWLKARALWIMGEWAKHGLRDDLSKLMIGVPLEAAGKDESDQLRSLFLRIGADKFKDRISLGSKEFARATADSSGAVRREALMLLRLAEADAASKHIVNVAKLYDGKDRFYLNAIGIAVGIDPKRREVILADFEKHFPELDDKTLDLIWELRPSSALARVEKKLLEAKLTAAERLRLVDVVAVYDEKRAGEALLALLRQDLPAEVRERALAAMRQHLPGKWKAIQQGPELARNVDALLAKAETRTTGLALVGVAGLESLLPLAQKTARDAKEDVATRKAAIQALGQVESKRAGEMLRDLLSVEPAGLRLDVVAALGGLAKEKGRTPGQASALSALQSVVAAAEKDEPLAKAAVNALVGSKAGTVWLLQQQEKGKLPDAVRADAGRLLRNTPHGDLKARVAAAFPVPGKLDPKKLPAIARLLKRQGDAEKGKKIMAASLKGDLQCVKCHTVRGVGGQIGPDLSAIGKKASRENLYESILYPSKAIADQYLTWSVETKGGQQVAGLIAEDTPEHLVVRDANGKDTKVSKKDVDSKTKSTASIMPDNLLAFMTEDELVDVVEYLLTLKKPSLTVSQWHIVGPFDNGKDDEGLNKVFAPEKGVDLKAEYAGKSGKVKWRTVKPDGQGYVDLAVHYGSEKDGIVSYLYQEIESPAVQEATILLGNDDAVKLWVNDTLIHTDRRHETATPEANSVKVGLKKGANKVLLKITNGDGPHGLFFSVVSELELKVVGK